MGGSLIWTIRDSTSKPIKKLGGVPACDSISKITRIGQNKQFNFRCMKEGNLSSEMSCYDSPKKLEQAYIVAMSVFD